MMNYRALNLTLEAGHAIEQGHHGQAIRMLDEARELLLPENERARPENDPSRSRQDRADWAAARKAG